MMIIGRDLLLRCLRPFLLLKPRRGLLPLPLVNLHRLVLPVSSTRLPLWALL